MEPGPDQIALCPNCRAKAKVSTVRSYSVFGGIWWTDGKSLTMAPDLPAITRCPECGHIYWVRDAEVIGEFYDWGSKGMFREKTHDEYAPWIEGTVPKEWKMAPPVRHLTEEELFLALAQGLGTTEDRERYLRVRAWWAHNDPYRDKEPLAPKQFKLSERAKENMERLFELLDESKYEQRLAKVELARELGRFEEAEELLKFDFPEHVRDIVEFLNDLIAQKDTIVREVPTRS